MLCKVHVLYQLTKTICLFFRLLEEETFADVTFQVANENLSAHVSVLSVRAPTFYQQFISRFMSSSSSPISINIQEIEAKQFKLFLRCVLCVTIKMNIK